MKNQISILIMVSLMLLLPLNHLFGQDSLIISEFMAINNKTLQDEDSTYSDWIEIFNRGTSPINLNGWCLSDDPADYSKWPFPAITIDPKEYIVVFASGKNRNSAKDSLHTNFRLRGSGEFLALSNPGSSVFSTVFTPAYPEQYDNISYTFYNGSYIYSSSPTPGFENDSGVFVSPPQFSMPHDFYDAPFKLVLTSEQPGADIYYTTDASTPDALNGILYSDSIIITRTTVIRAIAVIADTNASVTVASSYIFPDDVFTQFHDQPGYPDTWLQPENKNVIMVYIEIPTHYHMNQYVLNMPAVSENVVASIKSLPIVSIVTDIDNLFSKSTHPDSGGIYMYSGEPVPPGPTGSLLYHLGRGWERPASVEYFNSDEEDGSLDFQENCGLKIHGGASRSTRKTLKRSFKIGFKAKYGPAKLKEELFGEDAPNQYDRLILRGGFDRRLENQVVDPWVKSAMRDMGHYAARSKFVHLYLNGMYWGMYNLSEQIDKNCMRDNLGGRAGDYDIIKDHYEVEAGDTVAWDQLIALADDPANYQVLLGNHPDGTPDPSNERLLYPENLIDYIINNVYNSMGDWDNHNWMAARRRTNSEGFHFLVWDAEAGLRAGNKISLVMGGGYDNRPSGLFFDLMKNREFRDLFISRVNKCFFEGGALTPDPGLIRYEKWLDELDTALIADQARWYADESDIWNISHHTWIYNYFSGRTEEVFNQFIREDIYPNIEKPGFNISTNYIPVDSQLLFTAPEGAEIRYTTDNTDPGYYSPEKSGSIKVYDGKAIPLPGVGEKLTISARSKADTLWSALTVRTFAITADVLNIPDYSITENGFLFIYPNPGRNYTNIKYSLPEPSLISLKVYNHMGEYITSLEHGNRQQGEHELTWNFKNMPSGIYYCILEDYSHAKSYRIKIIIE